MHPTPARTQSPTRSQSQRQGLSTPLPDDGTSRRKRARDLSDDDSYPAKLPRQLSGVCLMQVTDGARNYVRDNDGFWRDKEDGTPLLVRLDIGDIYKRLVLKVCLDREFEVLVLKWYERWGVFVGYSTAAGIGFFIQKHVVDEMIWGRTFASRA